MELYVFLFMLFKSVFLFNTWLDLQEGVQAPIVFIGQIFAR